MLLWISLVDWTELSHIFEHPVKPLRGRVDWWGRSIINRGPTFAKHYEFRGFPYYRYSAVALKCKGVGSVDPETSASLLSPFENPSSVPLHNQALSLSKCPTSFVKRPCEWDRRPLPPSKSLPLVLPQQASPFTPPPLWEKPSRPDWWEHGSHLDREKSGQFKGLLLYFKRHEGVKETDEPSGGGGGRRWRWRTPSPLTVPPGSGAKLPLGEWARGDEPEGKGGGGGGINLRGGGNRSFLPPPFPALSHLQGLRRGRAV